MNNNKRRNFLKQCVALGLLPLDASYQTNESTRFENKRFSWVKNEQVDWNAVRAQFPLSKARHYFNVASLGPSPQSVVDKICETTQQIEAYCSPNRKRSVTVNKKIARLLNAQPEEIALTRNATESMNIVAKALTIRPRDEIVMTKHEHVGGAAPWIALQKTIGARVKTVEIGQSDDETLSNIKKSLTKKTKVVVCSHITCTTGALLPVKEIVSLCHHAGIFACIDGAQAVGMIPVDLESMNPDFYVASGHKWMYGPKGSGILYINRRNFDTVTPVFSGAYALSSFELDTPDMVYVHGAKREEYGTRNMPNILALGTAVDFIESIGVDQIAARGKALSHKFWEGLTNNPRFELLTPQGAPPATAIVTLKVKGVGYREVWNQMEKQKKSRTRAIYENHLDAIRFSFGIYNDMDEVAHAIKSLEEIAAG